MTLRMAGFERGERQTLLDRNAFVDKEGNVDYKRLVREVNRISQEMSREIKLLEMI